MPVPLRRSLGRLLSRVDSLLEDWSSMPASSPSVLSMSLATAASVVVSELSESGAEYLLVRRWELVKREGLEAEGDTGVVGLLACAEHLRRR